jgi:hypothetical protein
MDGKDDCGLVYHERHARRLLAARYAALHQ